MLPVNKGIFQSQQVVVVVLVHLLVQLPHCQLCANAALLVKTYQIEHRHFHHTLVEVRCSVLDNLDCNHLLCLQVLAFYDLSKSTLTQYVQDQIPVLMPRLLRAENVVYIEDVIAVLVVVSIVLDSFARLGEDSTWVSGRLVVELGIAQLIGSGQVGRERLKGLFEIFC
jgi:hypothetical protein